MKNKDKYAIEYVGLLTDLKSVQEEIKKLYIKHEGNYDTSYETSLGYIIGQIYKDIKEEKRNMEYGEKLEYDVLFHISEHGDKYDIPIKSLEDIFEMFEERKVIKRQMGKIKGILTRSLIVHGKKLILTK